MNVNAAHMNIIMNIITKFARIYTPIVVFAAIALAVVPTLFGGHFVPRWKTTSSVWVIRK